MAETTTKALKTVSATPTIDSSDAYQANDCVGGLLTFSNILLSEASTLFHGLTLNSLILSDLDNQAVEYDILFFSDNPSSSTITDDSAIDVHHDDADKFIGRVNLDTADFADLGSSGAADLLDLNLDLLIGDSDLFAAIVARGTPTFSTDHSLTLTLKFRLN